MSYKDSFLRKRQKGIGYAFKGFCKLLKNEASFQVQAIIAGLITIAGFYFNISTTEWVFQILVIALVMGIEGLNTAIESLADFVHPEQNQKIGDLKDLAAGAVFISAISAIIIACIIYIPKL